MLKTMPRNIVFFYSCALCFQMKNLNNSEIFSCVPPLPQKEFWKRQKKKQWLYSPLLFSSDRQGMGANIVLIILYGLTVLIFLSYVGGCIYFIWEIKKNQNSLVLNKRRTYPLVYLTLVCGSALILAYLIPITHKFFQLSPATGVVFHVLQTFTGLSWIYSLVLRVITQAREQCKWYELIDDKIPKNMFLQNERTYGNVKYVGVRVLGLVIISTLLSIPTSLLPKTTWVWLRLVALFFYGLCQLIPWLAVFLLAVNIPKSEDPYFIREEIQRIFVCVVLQISTILIILSVEGLDSNDSNGSSRQIMLYVFYVLVSHCLAFFLFVNMYVMSSWVVSTLKKRNLLGFEVDSTPDINELNKWHTDEVLKTQQKSEFSLEEVLSQSFGFDLLMRQMSDQLCHGVYICIYVY
ncbi:hypothetical protein RFI_12819, partial [Reticulomyxa filosa]